MSKNNDELTFVKAPRKLLKSIMKNNFSFDTKLMKFISYYVVISPLGELIGIVAINETSEIKFLDKLGVLPNFVGVGYGKLIIKALQKKYKNITLKCFNTFVVNEFYVPLGFKVINWLDSKDGTYALMEYKTSKK